MRNITSKITKYLFWGLVLTPVAIFLAGIIAGMVLGV
jgi:hypothetical protein